MNEPSESFLKICGMAGINNSQSQRLWLEVWRRVVSKFLFWLTGEDTLNRNQARKLLSIFQKIKTEGSGESNLIDWIFPVLTEDQKRRASQKFALEMLNGFNSFYETLFRSLSQNQKEAVTSFLSQYER